MTQQSPPPLDAQEERSSAVSLAFTGLHFGSIVGLVGAPLLINSLGWRALFWVFGAAGGAVWCCSGEG